MTVLNDSPDLTPLAGLPEYCGVETARLLDALEGQLPPGFSAKQLFSSLHPDLWQENPVHALACALERCGIFDRDDYYSRYPDVANSRMDAIVHFARHGIWENRFFRTPGNLALAGFYGGEGRNARNRPAVSVLMPVYNNASYLEECLDSAVGQTLENIEIIIIDDGSDDEKAIEIMALYAASDKRIHIIRKQNSGYGHSMNVGLRAARGEYIAILESDDYVDRDAYRRMYDIAARHDLDFVKTDFERFYGLGDERVEYLHIYGDRSKYNRVLNSLEDDGRYFDILNVIWIGLYKRDFLIRNNIKFNESPGASFQDNGFFFQTYIHARRFMFADFATYKLRRDNAESSVFSREKAFAGWGEYRFIHDILSADPFLYNNFIRIFHYKKFANFLFTLTRTDKSFERVLVETYKKDFLQAYEAGEIDREIFGAKYGQAMDLINGRTAGIRAHKPEVSIILTVYNKAAYLDETLSSIIKQTFKNFELVIIDDGSTDGSSAILNRWAQWDTRIRVFRQNNQGPGAARNAGLKYACGEYTLMLDADDFFYPQLLEKMVKKMRSTGADFCVCESEAEDEGTGEKHYMHYALKWNLLPQKDCFSPAEIAQNPFRAFVGWAWDKMYKTSFIRVHGLLFPRLRNSEDGVFVYQGLTCAEKISICGGGAMIVHRYNSQNSVADSRIRHPLEFIKAVRIIRDGLIERAKYEKYRRAFLSWAIHYFLWNIYTLRDQAIIDVSSCKKMFIYDLEINRHPKSYFLDERDYVRFLAI